MATARRSGDKPRPPGPSEIAWEHVERRRGPVPTVEHAEFTTLRDAADVLQRRGLDVLAYRPTHLLAYDNELRVVRDPTGRYGVATSSVEAERAKRHGASTRRKLGHLAGRMVHSFIDGLFSRN
ncbi:MAG: hypothetical protein OEY23_24840 [Acidimicrobiia bacterium]|nr:hypothetical protein [Acidimicrobiia bacterium]